MKKKLINILFSLCFILNSHAFIFNDKYMELFKSFLYQFDDTVNAEASNTQKYGEKYYTSTTDSQLSTMYDDENSQETTEKPNYEIIYYNPNTNVDNHNIKDLIKTILDERKQHKKQSMEKSSNNCELNKDKESEQAYIKTRHAQNNANSKQKTLVANKERKNSIPKENSNANEDFEGVVIALPNVNAKQLHKLLSNHHQLRRMQLKLN